MRPNACVLLAVMATLSANVRAQEPERTYFEFQVTKPVRALPVSHGPKYPADLRAAGTTGAVLVQFVVDTLGVPVMSSFKVLKSDHVGFTEAVKTWLATARFEPAELSGRKVRQLAQQPFEFAIAKNDSVGTTTYGSGYEGPQFDPFAHLPLTPAPHGGHVDGWMLEQQTTMTDGTGTPRMSFKTRWFGSKNRLRLQMLVSAMSEGIVMIMEADSLTTSSMTVTPLNKTVMKVRLPSSLPFFTGIMPLTEDVVFTDLGAGEPINGFPTRHYRLSGRSRSVLTVGDSSCTYSAPFTADTWLSNDSTLRAVSAQMRSMRAFFREIAGSDPTLSVRSGDAPPGALVRWKADVAGSIGSMPAGTAAATVDVTAAYVGSLDASLFEPPQGYRMLDASAFFRGNADSVAASISAQARRLMPTLIPKGGTRTCKATRLP